MSRRNSGRTRKAGELYETPAWPVLDGLVPHFPIDGLVVSEPACGSGQMVRALLDAGAGGVVASDRTMRSRYLKQKGMPPMILRDFAERGVAGDPQALDAVITNPPYGPRGETACLFIVRGLEWLRANGRSGSLLALLLPEDFDCAATRANLFELCPEFHATIKLRRRIEFFKRRAGAGGPSENHAWFVWRIPRFNPPARAQLLYAPRALEA